MVVDNQPDVTITLKIGLEEDGGFNVDTFTDPERALSSFKPGLYDLILVDIMMSKMERFCSIRTDKENRSRRQGMFFDSK